MVTRDTAVNVAVGPLTGRGNRRLKAIREFINIIRKSISKGSMNDKGSYLKTLSTVGGGEKINCKREFRHSA